MIDTLKKLKKALWEIQSRLNDIDLAGVEKDLGRRADTTLDDAANISDGIDTALLPVKAGVLDTIEYINTIELEKDFGEMEKFMKGVEK